MRYLTMRDKTSPKTTPSTMSTTKTIDALIGSDEDMIIHGFHPSSQTETQEYGKFLNREGFFSIAIGLVRRRIFRSGQSKRAAKILLVSAWQTGGSYPLPCHQPPHQSGTRQSEATSTVVFEEQSGQFRMTDLRGPVLVCSN
jgi:hypothetical protein